MIGKYAQIKFNIGIDSNNVELANADVFRLYELLRATLEVHCHKGFYLMGSQCQNLTEAEKADF